MEKISQGVLPSNKTDFVTMLHDIDYLRNAGQNADEADDIAIANSDNSLPGMATKIGLNGRKALGLTFNNNIEGLTYRQTRQLGERLLTHVKTHDPYKKLFDKYSINPNDYRAHKSG